MNRCAAANQIPIGPFHMGPIDNPERRYIMGIVNYYQIKAGYKDVTPLDWHFLTTWYEQGIPVSIVLESITTITKRRGHVRSMWYFDSHIQRAFAAYRQLQVGASMPAQESQVVGARASEEVEPYPELTPAQKDELLKKHANDEELRIKTVLFLRYLRPELRTEEVKRRYQINYILHRRSQ